MVAVVAPTVPSTAGRAPRHGQWWCKQKPPRIKMGGSVHGVARPAVPGTVGLREEWFRPASQRGRDPVGMPHREAYGEDATDTGFSPEHGGMDVRCDVR